MESSLDLTSKSASTCMCSQSLQSCLTLQLYGLWLLCPWASLGKHTEMGCHFLLLGLLPPQGLNPHLLHCQGGSLVPAGKPWRALATNQTIHILIVIFLCFSGTSILFSIMAPPTCIPKNIVQGFSILHMINNFCYLLTFWWQSFWQVWGKISLLFWFSFLWWLVMGNIFLCACWPFVYLIWKSFRSPVHLLIEDCVCVPRVSIMEPH